MSFKKIHETLNGLEARHRNEVAGLDKRIEELSVEKLEAEQKASIAEGKAKQEVDDRVRAERRVTDLETEIIEVRASVASEVETLRTEKEMLAQRDRYSRDELDRLRKMKIAERTKK